MGRQNRELLENLRKYEEKKAKQQESKILGQKQVKQTKNKREKIIHALLNSNNKKYKGDFIRLFMDNLLEEKRMKTKKKDKNVV